MLILCYHELAEEETTPWILKPETFAEHLAILQDRGYQFGRLPTSPSEDPSDDRRVVITFDDGTIGCIRHAFPWLERFQITAYFYICPGYISGEITPYYPATYMSWPDIRDLAQHHVLGAHSMTHCVFDRLPREQRLWEMQRSKAEIETQVGRPCVDFATPYGFVDEELQQLARVTGFSTLVTTEAGLNRTMNPYRLERWEVHSPGLRDDFVRQLEAWESSL